MIQYKACHQVQPLNHGLSSLQNHEPINFCSHKITQFGIFYCRRAWKGPRHGQALVAHTCIPSYSGGRDQNDCGWSQSRQIVLQDPISKTPFTKMGW
jgi:hypothetical protein